jgi:AcrR family transcriptional regulator
LFGEQGYEKTTVADIAREANVAHGTFYLYFDNKHDVFLALVATMGEHTADHARSLWREEPSTVDAIWLSIRDFLVNAEENRDLWRLLEEISAADRSVAELRSDLRSLFVSRIRRGLEVQGYPAGVDLDLTIVAELLNALSFRFARQGRLPGSAEVVAFHVTYVWAKGLGFPDSEIDHLRERFQLT